MVRLTIVALIFFRLGEGKPMKRSNEESLADRSEGPLPAFYGSA
jgi:hypothetical protein